ncbi:MAG: CHAT domain-containing protein [Chloroflexia bacterium]|nr:CHAT domain-containing protein [Chloroflexia bacterium]
MKDVKYIHVASHSFANDKFPSLSGIAFSQPDTCNNSKNANDGILYASETYNLDLSNAELLVLSSCKSGLGKLIQGEGFLSLSRGFLYSGVPNILFSLWNVNDEATKDLMVEFYMQILKGKPYAVALQKPN